jgi:hypothetical protein
LKREAERKKKADAAREVAKKARIARERAAKAKAQRLAAVEELRREKEAEKREEELRR